MLVQRLVLRRGVKILTDARRQVAHDVVYILSAAEAQAAMLVQRRHAQKAQARGAVGKVDVRNALVGEFVRRAADGAGGVVIGGAEHSGHARTDAEVDHVSGAELCERLLHIRIAADGRLRIIDGAAADIRGAQFEPRGGAEIVGASAYRRGDLAEFRFHWADVAQFPQLGSPVQSYHSDGHGVRRGRAHADDVLALFEDIRGAALRIARHIVKREADVQSLLLAGGEGAGFFEARKPLILLCKLPLRRGGIDLNDLFAAHSAGIFDKDSNIDSAVFERHALRVQRKFRI